MEFFCELPATLATIALTFTKNADHLNFRLAHHFSCHSFKPYWDHSLDAQIALAIPDRPN